MATQAAARHPMRCAHLLKDITSQTVTCHMNFVLRHVVPHWYMEGYMRGSREGVLAALKLTAMPENGVLVGSFVDGFTIPDVKLRDTAGRPLEAFGQRYDLDMLLMSNLTAGYKLGECDGLIDTTRTYPGYFRVVSKLGKPGQIGEPEAVFDLLADVPEDIGTEFEIHGPAFMINNRGMGFDMVPTGRCSCWPSEAHPWLSRPTTTGWPSWSTKRAVLQNKCHFVQKAHSSSSDPSSEFRFSFVMGEKLLVSTLSVSQKQCFVIFKTIVKNVVSEDSAISSYCLKTTLFWTLEKIPQSIWEDKINGTAVCCLELLDMLIHFLCERNIPQFFIPENNLIIHVDKGDLEQDIRSLLKLRRRPVETVLEYDNTYCLPTSVHGFMDEMPKILPHSTAHYKITSNDQETLEDCLKLHHRDSTQYFSHMVKIQSISGAIETMQDLQFYELYLGLCEMSMVKFIHDYMEENKHMLDANEMEFLAILCSVTFLKDAKTTGNAAPIILLDAVFEMVMQLPDSVSCHFILHYLMFLVHCKKETVAYFIFETVEDAFIEERGPFFDFENQREAIEVLDDVLLLLFKENAMVKFPCRVLFYYMYIRLCIDLDLLETALEKMATLEMIYPDELSDPTDYSYILLAFARMHVGNFWDAATAFDSDVYHRYLLYTKAGVDEQFSWSLLQRESGERAHICRALALYELLSGLE